ncbi:carboxymuconolactone decarboxylase family protein [Micromonospora carbonacea]|uniref:Carboxymuconolactone decarboxylase family protein n=1 Tax=Micromonospora carbonacea TaxID=47853 RepID=A0A7H8XN03_9ACTN|nr:carboxymuconolactone decarboxylase family protein [Micromonospora carbonacea]MBB5826557.1 AhpD family alkylhydroperoxidase [Micromonospora carbonacea]QLD26060.1 carboxymuconolactone decarboxylase family protein [Micromonospora carbonacea]
MPASVLRPVLGSLGLTQIRYVDAVRRGRASGLVAEVYRQVERDFGVLAPPMALHAPAPEVLAAAWLLMRETLIVPGAASRAAKETVATSVSLGNTCPYCATIHNNALGLLTGVGVGVDGRARPDPGSGGGPAELEGLVGWAMPVGGNPPPPPFPAAQTPELVGVAVLLHYLNRVVNVFLRDVPLPPGVPELALPMVLRVLGWAMMGASRRPHGPGLSLDLLPAAPLPADLSWAAGSPTIAEAFGRASAAIEAAGRRSVPEAVRDLVLANLVGWHGGPRGISRSWVEGLVEGLPEAQRPIARLALLVAFASYQVDPTVVRGCRLAGVDDRALVEVSAWSAMAAARWLGGRLAAPQ